MEEQNNSINIPSEYQPISMWGYVGYTLLFSIPCVGLILVLVYSFGGTQNINLRNWARSHLVMIAIVVVLYLLLLLFGVGSLMTAGAMSSISGY